MSIKPIDIQTNIGQMHEIARQNHSQNESLIQQMHHLDREAQDKNLQADSRLDESAKSDEVNTRLDDRRGEGKRRGKGKKGIPSDEGTKIKGIELVKDQNLGRFIDIKK